MRSYLFCDDDIHRYALDLTAKLQALGDHYPTLWFPLGESGDKIAEVLMPLVPAHLRERTTIEPISFFRTDRRVSLRNGDPLGDYAGYPSVLIIDGAVHSGASMARAVRDVAGRGAPCVLSYSFVVKRTSAFIPNYFSILIEEHDRPYFQLDVIPNNLLQEEPPFGILRRIAAEDVNRSPAFLRTGVPSIDRVSLGDLWYSDRKDGARVFLYECDGAIASYISFLINDNNSLYVDLIAADNAFKGRGIGGVLMRWAGTYARSTCCSAIELNAHADRVEFYRHYGFAIIPGAEPIDIGGGEKYVPMRKPIIYTGNPVHLTGMQNGRV